MGSVRKGCGRCRVGMGGVEWGGVVRGKGVWSSGQNISIDMQPEGCFVYYALLLIRTPINYRTSQFSCTNSLAIWVILRLDSNCGIV